MLIALALAALIVERKKMKASNLQLIATLLYIASGVAVAFFMWPYGLIISALWSVAVVISILNYKNKKLEERASNKTNQTGSK